MACQKVRFGGFRRNDGFGWIEGFGRLGAGFVGIKRFRGFGSLGAVGEFEGIWGYERIWAILLA